MVGVPRSKGCISCRARRKGCDARRPSCTQCIERGVECPGYARSLKIVQVEPGAKFQTAAVKKTTKDPFTPAFPALLELIPCFVNSAFRSQTYGFFVADYAPHAVGLWPRLQTNLDVLPATSWLGTAIAVAQTDPVLNNALTALALAQVGRMTKQTEMLESSRKVYAEAVAGLNKKLRHEQESLEDGTLAAASALSIYEMQEGSPEKRSENWASHVKGASTLIHLRGRSNFSTPLSNRVFLGVQIAELIAAIGNRAPSINASLWSQVHEDSMSESRFALPMQLFEILHTLPRILGDGETIISSLDTAKQDAERIKQLLVSFRDQCQNFETRLLDWYDNLESKQQGSHESNFSSPSSLPWCSPSADTDSSTSELFWFEPSTLYDQLPQNSPHRIFPFFICFTNPDIAYQVVLHWTGLLLMHSMLFKVRMQLQGLDSSKTVLRFPPFTSPNNSRSVALLIAQSLEYIVHPDMGLLGSNIIGFPLSVTQRFFQHSNAVELLWLDMIFQRMREMKSGLHGFLADMAKGDKIQLKRCFETTANAGG